MSAQRIASRRVVTESARDYITSTSHGGDGFLHKQAGRCRFRRRAMASTAEIQPHHDRADLYRPSTRGHLAERARRRVYELSSTRRGSRVLRPFMKGEPA